MLNQLQPIRLALESAISELNIPVFAQRKINEDDIEGSRFVSLTLSRSDSASEGVEAAWRISMVLGIYIENPATDSELESLANDVNETISASADVNSLVCGVLFEGHEYPDEQGDAYAALDIQYTITL